jgi:hypothetical protein
MTHPRSSTRMLPSVLALVWFASATSASAQSAADMQVFSANCTLDYFEFCSGLSPNGPEVRACFRQNRANLSSGCASAISSYERRQAARGRDAASE